jgi:hypothetical protein
MIFWSGTIGVHCIEPMKPNLAAIGQRLHFAIAYYIVGWYWHNDRSQETSGESQVLGFGEKYRRKQDLSIGTDDSFKISIYRLIYLSLAAGMFRL